jgi:tRNA A37 threonylcarbamoyladenosine dehydratase
MAKKTEQPALPAGQQDIDALKERYDALNKKKIQAETNQEAAEKRLKELKEQARRDYGTDNLDELKQKLDELKADNERKRAEYQKHLDAIELKLSEVEQQHKAAT